MTSADLLFNDRTEPELILTNQEDWRDGRITSAPGLPRQSLPKKQPRVLIVDDDVDLAYALQTGLRREGIFAEVITQTDEIHRRISFDRADFILLDWMLDEHLTADMVVSRSIRLIDAFSDLREKFTTRPPRVVTFSVLERSLVRLPPSKFFDHHDHLEKSLPHSDVITKLMQLIAEAA